MKNKFLKALLAIALCTVMVFPLAACGNDGGNGGNGGGNGGTFTPTGELQFDEDGNVVFKQVSIKLETVVNGDDRDPLQAIVSKFNLLYKGKINVVITNTDALSYENSVSSKIANGNNAPDLLMSHQKSHRNFADNNLIQPFDNIMQQSGINIDLSNFSDGLAKYAKHGTDNLYSIPVDGQTHVCFYNKKELAKTGFTLPTNRTELLAVCDAYKKSTGRNAIAWSTGADYFANYIYLTACLQNGAKLYNEDNFQVDWYSNEANRTAITNASKSIRDLINNGYAKLNAASSDNLTGFLSGSSLFYFTDPWSMLNLVNKYIDQEKCTQAELFENILGGACFSGWFAMTENAQQDLIFGDSHFFAMSKTCTDRTKQAAILTFINWFTTDAGAGADWAEAGHVSASKSITNSNTYKTNAYVTNFINAFYPNIDNFVSVGSTPYYAEVIDNLKGLCADTINENTIGLDKTPDDARFIRQREEGANNNIGFFG